MSGAATAMVPSGSTRELPALSSSGTGPSSPPLVGTDVFKDNGFDRASAPVQQLLGEKKGVWGGGIKKKKKRKDLMIANILPRA